MVRKLFKHELKYYIRSLAPMYIVLAVVALLGRIVFFFEEESTAYEILQGSSIFMLVVACVAALFLCELFCLVRFYKNLFSGEGYLTMTLPATPTQHLLTKLLGAVIANLATLVAVILAVCLFTVGPWLVEICKAIAFLFKRVLEAEQEPAKHVMLYLAEYGVVLLAALFTSLLIYYACICVGQLAKKNRIIAAIGTYFGLYVITQIAGTVLIAVASVTDIMEKFGNWLSNLEDAQFYAWTHGFFWIAIGCILLVGAGFFLISKLIISRKLNLE